MISNTTLVEAGISAFAAFSAGMYYAAGVPSSQVFGPSLVRAESCDAIALTFDDGPSETTPAILEALAATHSRATFFQVGSNALRLPSVARDVTRAGHEIANHTFAHPRFYLCSPGRIAQELERCQQALSDVHGEAPRLFRPPYGARWFGMYPAMARLGLRSVMWSVSSRDWEQSAPSSRTAFDSRAEWIALRVIRDAKPGDVVLLHDGDTTTPGDRRRATAAALRTILTSFQTRGIRATTVSELFALTA